MKRNTTKRGARSLQRMVRRFGRWVANACGLLVVPPEAILEWVQRASEHNRIAGDYDMSDARLSGLNDGRCQAYNHCAQMVRELNTPNAALCEAADKKR